MLANKLFPLLSRPDVHEIVLLVGKPPCALVDGSYRRLSAQLLQEQDVMAVLAAAHGQEYLPRLADGARWEFQLPSVGVIAVSAVYDGPVLKASLRLMADARPRVAAPAARAAKPPPTPRTEPRSGPLAANPQPEPPPPPPRARGISDAAFVAQPSAAQPSARSDAAFVAPGARQRVDSSSNIAALSLPPRANSDEAVFVGQQPIFEAPEPQPLIEAAFDLPAPDRPALLSLDPPPRAAPAPVAAAPVPARAVGGDMLDELLGRARALAATDMHVLADRPPMLRIAGDLVPQGDALDAAYVEQLLLARVPANLQETLLTSGSCDFPLVHPRFGRFRANVSRQRTGLKLTARPIGAQVPTLAELGLPEAIEQAVHHHQGLIVITGPTGHGKTTTLAAIVGILNRETSHHVITVEDPIEYVHELSQAVISQREVGTHTKSFQAALKGSLREDPDVIVVGELRDTETVRMALTASETGHLVISTMNTPSAAKTIERLIDLFPPGDQPQVRMTLAGGLRLVISQRLLPTADRQGLCVAAELLPGSVPLWNLIRDNRTYQIASVQQRGKSLGIVRLDDSLAQLVKSGRTTLEIARDYAESPEGLEAAVRGRPAPPQPTAAENNNMQQRGVDLGKQVLSRAGKLFGGDKG
jgi:twitching motility protein PilT